MNSKQDLLRRFAKQGPRPACQAAARVATAAVPMEHPGISVVRRLIADVHV
ncbi:hypothetical protein [Mesorhizobium sp.]|uniref:hypothetical protein n=1 Tax=Mesorhizobium sp. TaxID=1871066 RepID=UPI0025CBCB6C|nr:hypothetical protein [Mesorhizobium sp.]